MKTHRVVVAMAVVIGLVSGCGPGKVPGRVVRIVQDTSGTLALTMPIGWAGIGPETAHLAWLRPGSMFMGEETALLYQASDGDSLQLDASKWRVALNGQVVTLSAADSDAVPWLGRATPADLRAIRLLVNAEFPSDAVRPLAAANPHVALFFEHRDAMAEILPLFRPRWLGLGEDVDSIGDALASQPDIEILWVTAPDSAGLTAIRALHSLRELSVSKWEPPYAGRLPERLEALTLAEGNVNIQALDGLQKLRILQVSGSWWSGPLDLAGFKRLQWFGFPKNTTQADLAAMVTAHPNLEVIELLEINDTLDLTPLATLRRLRAVTLDGEFTNINVLKTIPTLEFVGISDDMWKGVSADAEAIQEALPRAVVVKVTTLCLGSGWILLIFPIVVLVMLAVPRRREA